ncbi:sulfatase family protein [Roseiconus lacunae]|uniref:sulfatase family protein n=1 Tax=Roseiconus lacunae TaxID=2605694 RepID=UPI001E3678F3|nr:sulfatase [Roseiconus lacunae]MCD0460913.1 sulfatase [Roseiconus lacunae]
MKPSLVFTLVLLCSLSVGKTHADDDSRPPNFVFIIADDCTFRDIGCYGGQAHTPNIDALATEGMLLTECYQAAPMCSPTRHNIYTGLYPVRSGAYPNHTFAKDGTKSIAHYLAPLDYRVALSGKTHIGPKEVFPFEYSGKKNPDMDAVDGLFSECAKARTPFCLLACSNEPHSPWNKGDSSRYPVDEIKLPPYLVDTPVVRENFARYLAEITYFDNQVGQILERLEHHGLTENTVVMVVSEQGNSFPFAKWTCYSSGLQSAMVVRWPGKIQAGSTSDAMVEYVDITPTFIEAAGLPAQENLDGKSFLPVLRGEAKRHKTHSYGLMTTRGIIAGSDLFAIRTVRDDRYRLIWNLNHDATFTNACTEADYFRSMQRFANSGDANAKELVDRYMHRPEYELFDCQADPLEMNNLAQDPAYAEHVERLKSTLLAWMEEQGDEGVKTERDAILHQSRYKKLDSTEAFKVYRRAVRNRKKNPID